MIILPDRWELIKNKKRGGGRETGGFRLLGRRHGASASRIGGRERFLEDDSIIYRKVGSVRLRRAFQVNSRRSRGRFSSSRMSNCIPGRREGSTEDSDSLRASGERNHRQEMIERTAKLRQASREKLVRDISGCLSFADRESRATEKRRKTCVSACIYNWA